MKRFALFLSIILIALLSCSCMMRNNTSKTVKITSDFGNSYTFIEIEANSGSAYWEDLNVYKADADELREVSVTGSNRQVTIPGGAQEAAQIGASILDETYENWSEAGTVCVFRNDTANAWIVHGQMKDRNSTTGCGVVAIKADTGEILYMAKSL